MSSKKIKVIFPLDQWLYLTSHLDFVSDSDRDAIDPSNLADRSIIDPRLCEQGQFYFISKLFSQLE